MSLNPLDTYITSLIDNLDKNSIKKNIDLVLSGGAFNGGYQHGIMLYLSKLEELKLLKIDKISGCSVGALIGTFYLTNNVDKIIPLYNNLLKSFRSNCFLTELSKTITYFINNFVDDVSILNNKLYISYYDMQTINHVVVSTYKTKNDLIECLIKSTYIPYINNGELQYKGCCDGFTPHIFPKTDKYQLYINLLPLKKITKILYIKNEENIWPRLLYGINDINNFYSKSTSGSEFCKYVNDWSIKDIFVIRLYEIVSLIIVLIINVCLFINNKIPNNFKQNIYFKRLSEIIITLYKELFSHILL